MGTAVFGAPEWRARSGRTVKQGEDGALFFQHLAGYLSSPAAMDAEEFFQAKRDAELGRWRWPENPDYVVYPDDDGDVVVLNERDCISGLVIRGDVAQLNPESNRTKAARAYFEAHPERKPWADAKYGEVWQVEHTGGQVDLCRVNAWEKFEQVSGTGVLVSMPITHESITAAERVWPEDES